MNPLPPKKNHSGLKQKVYFLSMLLVNHGIQAEGCHSFGKSTLEELAMAITCLNVLA